MPLNTEFLSKVAVYGAVLSVSGSAVLYYLIQRNIARSPYYTEAVQALRRDERVCKALGEPIRFQFLQLANKENRVTESSAQVLIPVSGAHRAGHLRSNAIFENGQWHLQQVVLEFKGRPQTMTVCHSKPHQ